MVNWRFTSHCNNRKIIIILKHIFVYTHMNITGFITKYNGGEQLLNEVGHFVTLNLGPNMVSGSQPKPQS